MDTITLTGTHIREACRLLRWNTSVLSRKAHLPYNAVRLLKLSKTVDSEMAGRLLRLFEAAGVEFIPENGSGAGVRMKKGMMQ